MIFSGYGLKKDYDYIWPIKDRSICNELMLKTILKGCAGYPDVMISLSIGNVFGKGEYVDFSSPVELYRCFAKQTTSLGTVVYNKNTILKDYKYGLSRNAPRYKNDFWHYHFLYEELARTPAPTIRIISRDGAYNPSVDSESLWTERIFEVWIEEWIRINFELPEIYSPYKLLVIKDTTSITDLLGDKATFIKLHDNGILTRESFNKYAGMWEYVTTIPVDEIEQIACS